MTARVRISRFPLLRAPLLRLMGINLAAGAGVAVLLLGGLLTANPHRLRDLILADYSPATAIGLLLFGLFITFGSAAMGTAIMSLGGSDDAGRGRKAKVDARAEPAPARATASLR